MEENNYVCKRSTETYTQRNIIEVIEHTFMSDSLKTRMVNRCYEELIGKLLDKTVELTKEGKELRKAFWTSKELDIAKKIKRIIKIGKLHIRELISYMTCKISIGAKALVSEGYLTRRFPFYKKILIM